MEFIYDRTIEDVQEAIRYEALDWDEFSEDEKEKWLSGLKGSFNYTDYNRIINNIRNLAIVKDYPSREPLIWTTGYKYAEILNITSSYICIINPKKQDIRITMYNSSSTIPFKIIETNEPLIAVQSKDMEMDNYYEYNKINLSANLLTADTANNDIIVNAIDIRYENLEPNFILNKMNMQHIISYEYINEIVEKINFYFSDYDGTEIISMKEQPDYNFYNQIEKNLYLVYLNIIKIPERYSVTWNGANVIANINTGELEERDINLTEVNILQAIQSKTYIEIHNPKSYILVNVIVDTTIGKIERDYYDDQYRQINREGKSYNIRYYGTKTKEIELIESEDLIYTEKTEIQNNICIFNPKQKNIIYTLYSDSDNVENLIGSSNNLFVEISKENYQYIELNIDKKQGIIKEDLKAYEYIQETDIDLSGFVKAFVGDNPLYTLIPWSIKNKTVNISENIGWSSIENPNNIYILEILNQQGNGKTDTYIENIKLYTDELRYSAYDSDESNYSSLILKESAYAKNSITSDFIYLKENNLFIKIIAPDNVKIKVLKYRNYRENLLYYGFTEKFGINFINTQQDDSGIIYRIVAEATSDIELMNNIQIYTMHK